MNLYCREWFWTVIIFIKWYVYCKQKIKRWKQRTNKWRKQSKYIYNYSWKGKKFVYFSKKNIHLKIWEWIRNCGKVSYTTVSIIGNSLSNLKTFTSLCSFYNYSCLKPTAYHLIESIYKKWPYFHKHLFLIDF